MGSWRPCAWQGFEGGGLRQGISPPHGASLLDGGDQDHVFGRERVNARAYAGKGSPGEGLARACGREHFVVLPLPRLRAHCPDKFAPQGH